MHLHLRAADVDLNAEHARALDDEFFLSHPSAYFSSRISALLSAERSPIVETDSQATEFFAALSFDNNDAVLQFENADRDLQIAVDALSVRHHAAEALLRLLYAVTAAETRAGDSPCVWLAIADSPTSILDVVKKTVAALDFDDELFLRTLIPQGTRVNADVTEAVKTAAAWVNHAIDLLINNELSTNAANNKVKHGLAVSARGDVRIELITTPPNEHGEIPLSAFEEGKSIPIFDRPMVTYLSRSPIKPKQGLESVSLRVDVPIVLAEAWMISNVYAAIFHVAARKHFGDVVPEGMASYPTLALSRRPEQVIGSRPLGYRTAITLPPNGTTLPRPSGLFFHGSFWPMDIDMDSKVQGVVTDG